MTTHRRDDEESNPYSQYTPKELKHFLKKRKLIFNGSKDKCVARLLVDDLSHQINRIFGHNLQIGYTFGSRLYGNAKQESDFDFLVVISHSAFNQSLDEETLLLENAELRSIEWFFNVGWFPDLPEVRLDFHNHQLVFIDEGYYQVWIISEISFKSMIAHCIPLALECLSLEFFISQQKKLHNSYLTDQEHSGYPFIFRHGEMVKTGCKFTTEIPRYPPSQIYKNFGLTSKTMWLLVKRQLENLAADSAYSSENSTLAIPPKKFHAIEKHMYNSFRILTFGIQIAKFGRINNFRASNSWRTEIVNKIPDKVNPREHLLLIEKQQRLKESLLNLFQYFHTVCHIEEELVDLFFIKEHTMKALEYNVISEQAMRNLNSPEITNNWLRMVTDANTMHNLSLVCKQFYNLLHDVDFIQEMCFKHFGEESCFNMGTGYGRTWFSCFKLLSWLSQFGSVKYNCPLCQDDSIDHHSLSYQLYSAMTDSREFREPYRNHVFKLSCSAGSLWQDSTYYRRQTHVWGKISSAIFSTVWNTLPVFKDKEPHCVMCPATHTKNATEFVFGKDTKASSVQNAFMCSNGHFCGMEVEMIHKRFMGSDY